MDLNPEQEIVANARDGAYCVVAGPGAGKTATLVERVRRLIDSGVRPTDILCLSFTKEAAAEMLRRTGGARSNFRTFHSLGYHIVSREKGDQPVEPELRHRLICKLMRMHALPDYKQLTQYISKQRHLGVAPEQAVDEAEPWGYSRGLAHAYFEYEKERKAAGWIDFDSMIADCLLLLEDPFVQMNYQYPYVMADECQDTDSAQFRILQLLTERHGNIMCIGDPAQSIYMFRGAEPDNLLKFEQWFAGGQYLYLGQNYRSTQTITSFVRENYPIETPLKEKLIANRTETGTPVEYKKFANEWDEAEDALANALLSPENTAILARTNRSLGVVEALALEHNIKYHLLGKSGFWVQREVKKAIDKLKVAPVSTLPVERALDVILPDIEAFYRTDDATPEDNWAIENLQTLREIAARKKGTGGEFASYAVRCANIKRKDGVALGTVHAAKGLEYKQVIVIGCADGMMPHAKSISPAEEARIFFVAVSRAKDRLRITWCGRHSPYLAKYLQKERLDNLAKEMYTVERIQKQIKLGI